LADVVIGNLSDWASTEQEKDQPVFSVQDS